METRSRTLPGLGRAVIAGVGAITLAIIWTHALAAVLRPFGPETAPLAARSLTIAAALVTLLGVATWRLRASFVVPFGAGVVAVAVLQTVLPGSWTAALAIPIVATLAGQAGLYLSRRLPARLDDVHRRRTAVAGLWLMIGIMAIVQTGRLATYMTDADYDWYLSTRHPFWAKHECISAYFHASELHDRGEENIYDAVHYPGLNPTAEPVTDVAGLVVEDPYQYPPQFLLLPKMTLAATQNFPAIRLVWFALQTTLFLAIAAWLALWMGGAAGSMGLFLLPLAFTAFPAMHTFQYGQFHLATVVLAIAGMVLFATKRSAAGGAMLAGAVLAKVFPGLLLIFLAVQRRWRDLGWTLGWMSVITLIALATLGTAPFVAFFEYHLPRLANGQAFAFGEAWPEVREMIIADNQGAFGLATKLSEMGVRAMSPETAIWIGRIYAIFVALGTAWAARYLMDGASREQRAISWLAILGLGSMMSTGAFGDYVPVTCTWMMTLLAYRMTGNGRWLAILAPCWALQYFLIGTSPIGDWFRPDVMIPLSAVSVVAMFGVFAWVLMGQPAATPVRSKLQPIPSRTPLTQC